MLHEARQISIAMSDPVLNEETIDQVRPSVRALCAAPFEQPRPSSLQ